MKQPKKRPRTRRRSLERELKKIEDAREKLARLSPGGSPDRPIEVVSASVVEPQAAALGCARCAAELRVEEHVAASTDAGPLRRVHARCKSCGAERIVWLRVAVRN